MSWSQIWTRNQARWRQLWLDLTLRTDWKTPKQSLMNYSDELLNFWRSPTFNWIALAEWCKGLVGVIRASVVWTLWDVEKNYFGPLVRWTRLNLMALVVVVFRRDVVLVWRWRWGDCVEIHADAHSMIIVSRHGCRCTLGYIKDVKESWVKELCLLFWLRFADRNGVLLRSIESVFMRNILQRM